MTAPAIRVLACEDSTLDAKLIERELERAGLAFTFRRTATLAEAQRALEQETPDIVLADYRLPDGVGTELLGTVRRVAPLTPVILVTGTLGEERAVDAVKAGATDYVLKSNLARLPQAMTRALAEAEERRRAEVTDRSFGRLSQRVRALHELGLSVSPALEDRIHEALRLGCDWFDTGQAVVIRDVSGEMELVVTHGLDILPERLPLTDTVTAGVIRAEGALALPSEFPPPHMAHRVFSQEAMSRWIGAPLHVSSRPFGSVEFAGTAAATAGAAHPFDQTDRASVQLLARWISAELERDLLTRQLTVAQKMEAVGTLAGGVAHDFNNLIGVILSSAELLRLERGDEGPHAEEVGEIIAAAERARALTLQLLAFGRHEVTRPVDFDLGALVLQQAGMIRRLVGADIEVVVTQPGDPVGVFADAGQTEQVVMNLCVNARDAMPSGGRISMNVAKRELGTSESARLTGAAPGMYAVLTVTDTGAGMDAQTLERIFEPFFTTKERGKGTGLGLATVWGIVGQHGGAVDVQSEPGRGTTFTIYLPFRDPPRTVPGGSTAATRAPVVAPQATLGTILLVDDEAALRRVTVRMLRKLGYTVLECGSAAEAVALANRHEGELSLALLDVMLPDGRGPALLAELRKGRPDLRALFASGYGPDAKELAGVELHGATWLMKPFNLDTMAEAVRRALEPPKAPPEAPPRGA